LEKFLNTLSFVLKRFEFVDVIDIFLVSVIIYYFIKFIRERRANKLAIGVVLVIGLLLFSEWLDMQAMNFLTSNIAQVGVVAILIVFQQEIRSALEQVGGNSIKTLKHTVSSKDKEKSKENAKTDSITSICQAVTELSRDYTGALIVIERDAPLTLGGAIKNGTVVNADICVSMLKNLFFNKAPLHDGAVIISKNRIYAAGCILPNTDNKDIQKDLGTRHRAAIGMSENSDAISVVVSEETGTISIAVNGELHRNYDYNTLKQELTSLLSKY